MRSCVKNPMSSMRVIASVVAVVTLLVFSAINSYAATHVACESFRGLPNFKPELTAFKNQTLRAAGSLAPEVIEFEGRGEIQILLSRYTRQFVANAALKVTAANAQGDFETVCQHTFVDLGFNAPLAGVVLHSATTRKLRFEVLDFGDGGPTGDPPYLIEFEIKSLGDAPQVTQHTISSDNRPATCEIVDGPRRKKTSLELVRKERLNSLREGHVFVGYAFGGRNLYLRLDEALPEGAYLTARLFSKPYGEQEFSEICRVDLSILFSSNVYLLASVPEERIFNPTWRVEIVVEPGGVSSTSGLSFSVLRDVDPERLDAIHAGASPAPYLCVKGMGRGGIPNTASRGFPASSVLAVNIDQSMIPLQPTALASIYRMLLNAVAIWRRACTSCLPENLLFVVLDGKLYTLPGAAAALIQPNPVRRGIPQRGDATPSLDNNRIGTRTPVQVFEAVNPNDEVIQKLCAMSATDLSSIAMAARQNLPCSGLKSGTTLDLKLVPMNRETSCGANPDIVACEPDRLTVELSAQNYTFRDADGTPLFGKGNRTVDLQTVMLHEIGHWIGLSHTATPQGIMSGSLDHARCVDTAAVNSLARIARGQEQPATGKMTLEYFAGGN